MKGLQNGLALKSALEISGGKYLQQRKPVVFIQDVTNGQNKYFAE